MKKNLHIIYFSGTGGTTYAASILKEQSEQEDMVVSLSQVYQGKPIVTDSDEILVIMYPVYAADAPRSIYKFIKTLAKGHNEIVIIPVSGGGDVSPNTAASYHVKRLLQKKGYLVIGEYHLVMPSNFIIPTEHTYAVELIHVLPYKCESIVKEINQGIHRLKTPLLRDHMIRLLCNVEKQGAKVFGRSLKISEECTSCGLCEKICPTANIKLINGEPKFSWSCDLCMACIYACPNKSIKARMMKSFVLKEGYDIKPIIKHANTTTAELEIKSDQKIWKGVVDYINSRDI